MTQITDGRYTLVYPDGQYRTLRLRTNKKGKFQGSVVLSIKVGHQFEGVGFLKPNNEVYFWRRFRESNPPERQQRIQAAVNRVAQDPDAAGLAYAMKENCCYRCGRDLTVPASIHKGMGPECARKTWTRQDQKNAYKWRAGQAAVQQTPTAQKYQHENKPFMYEDELPKNMPRADYDKWYQASRLSEGTTGVRIGPVYPESNPEPLWPVPGDEFDAEIQTREREQEMRGFASDPDIDLYRGPATKKDVERPDLSNFENERCLICRVPRYRCSC